jgi:hypothetical protein
MAEVTALISVGPNPVEVRMCLGREKSGPTGPFKSLSGALVEGRRSRSAQDGRRWMVACAGSPSESMLDSWSVGPSWR